MWIKPLRSMVGDYGRLRRNKPANIDKHLADKLIEKGLAVPSKAPAKGKSDGAKGGGQKPANPSKAAQDGGKTGKAKPSQ